MIYLWKNTLNMQNIVILINTDFCDRIKYHIMLKSNISGEFSHKCMKIKINTDYDLSLAKYIKYAKYSNTD